ncbi:Alpha/Beta hydrolase protein [Lineolata rhizophorae]|uniref:triacylglycerol lipase n=1 Tax=Lineolata rhizophorae TaxID=578093 RepID=A0A6A6P3D6_9PEZI|nr:Alpha/Beta hydrolase protein [Lineolata rhizophorae]
MPHARNLLLSFLTTSSAVLQPALAFSLFGPAAAGDDAQLPVLPPLEPGQPGGSPPPAQAAELDFKLRHIFHHGTYKYPELHRRLDIPDDARLTVQMEGDSGPSPAPEHLYARSRPLRIQRLVDRRRSTIDEILEQGRMRGKAVELPASAWTTDEIPGPNVTDKETVLSFARMAANAYDTGPEESEWTEVGGGFNLTDDFGWETDGLRGHIFTATNNQTVVIGLKGTSPAVFDGSETTTNDKENDNLFFSCCCGQGGQYLWRRVCDCQTGTYTCNSTCLTQELKAKNRYYQAAQELYHNVTELYPESDVWMAGHSLGGAVSSLLGLTFGLPVVTFEAVPEAMPAARLGLPTPPGFHVGMHQQRPDTGTFHFGHTADPIYMGTCNGASSFCTLGGYALQSSCHTGHVCAYDTVGDLGWRVGLGTHKIRSVIKDVIEKYDEPAACERRENCTDCFNWKFFESNGTETTTTSGLATSTSSSTRTRTETCKTPGWWGCLDETTSTGSATTTISSSSTSTCETPGWFGCKDPTMTTTSSTSTSSSAAPSPTVTTTSEPSSTTTTCEHPGWFGGCNDPTTTTTSSTSSSAAASTTSTASSAPPASPTCVARTWYGRCKEWSGVFGSSEL